MKRISWPVVVLSVVILFLLLAYANRDKLNNFISRELQEQAEKEVVLSAKEEVASKYNYAINGNNFDFTFLEFSSSGCAICKQMEPVLKEIKNSKVINVNVVFLHIMKSENQDLMKYYGISAVPMQILLNNEGKEFFRHYGFISTAELEKIFLDKKRNN